MPKKELQKNLFAKSVLYILKYVLCYLLNYWSNRLNQSEFKIYTIICNICSLYFPLTQGNMTAIFYIKFNVYTVRDNKYSCYCNFKRPFLVPRVDKVNTYCLKMYDL